MAVVLLAAMGGTSRGWEGEASDPYAAKIAELEAKVAALEAANGGESCGGDSCGELCGGDPQCGCYDCTRTGGLVFGAEITFLRPHHSMGTRGYDGTDLLFDFEAAPRFWMGWVNECGLGIRFRYWDFDHTQTVASQYGQGRTDSQRFDISVSDLEITDTMQLTCLWELTISGGVRYVDYDERRFTTFVRDGSIAGLQEFRSSTWGPTISAELRRPIWGCLDVFANVRGSAMFGDEDELLWDPQGQQRMLVGSESADVKFITEMQLGSEYNRPLSNGARLFFRGAVEAQYWSTFSGEPFYDGGEAVGFVGFTMSAGLLR